MNLAEIQNKLCSSLCADVNVVERDDGLLLVSTPFQFSDGDQYSIYLKALGLGGFRITDMGGTLMHLSYEHDIDKLHEGTRGKVYNQVLSEMGLSEDSGELFMEASGEALGITLVRFGQALTRIHDLTFLSRIRVESTFYDDLYEQLKLHVSSERIHENYIVPNVANASDYPVDFYIEGTDQPLYLFGVPNRDKARLATIILQHLNVEGVAFSSMVVFQNAADIAARDLSRLMNAANDMVDSLDASADLKRKLRHQHIPLLTDQSPGQ